ncbi:DUF1802 family protein [Stenomitos frigidus]|uniref:DUF1802 domain-containing protein n=1 Tax=Stenomitos frigidus ULC18 TaxID=2107698 RepID=A0A2T1EAM1_9CYAN|nr:DUF1802 family protein [Stenomitos frigidus]PSB29799.1 hypothetical protein C7B82_10605 [Stenomitos frigidus ULC18]
MAIEQVTQILTHALKEWQVAVKALEQGEMIVLLRKGGLRETGGRFTVMHDRILLYPTYEHQRSHLVKQQYADAITPVEPGWHPETVRLGSWAIITDRLQTSDAATVAALLPFHIWNETFVAERRQWKATQPIEVLLLRVYTLPQPQLIPYDSTYGGCKSWLDLTQAIPLDGSTPALEDRDYRERCDQIRAIVSQQAPDISRLLE